MVSLNIRNFPADLLRTLKAFAAARGVTLREYIVSVLEAPVEVPPPSDSTFRALGKQIGDTIRITLCRGCGHEARKHVPACYVAGCPCRRMRR